MGPRSFIPTEEDREIADRIRLRRVAARIKQGDFAKRVGISPRTLNRYEKCQRAIPRQDLTRIEDLLGPLIPPKPGERRAVTPQYASPTTEVPNGEPMQWPITEKLSSQEWFLVETFRYCGIAQRERVMHLLFSMGGVSDMLRDSLIRNNEKVAPYKAAHATTMVPPPWLGDKHRPPWDVLVPGNAPPKRKKSARRKTKKSGQ